MAFVRVKDKGAATVVSLNSSDRRLLSAAFSEYCSVNGLTAKQVAEHVGVSRQQIYVLLNSAEIELQRFIKIQKVLNIWLLDETSVDTFITALKRDLNPPDLYIAKPFIDPVDIKNNSNSAIDKNKSSPIISFLSKNLLKNIVGIFSPILSEDKSTNNLNLESNKKQIDHPQYTYEKFTYLPFVRVSSFYVLTFLTTDFFYYDVDYNEHQYSIDLTKLFQDRCDPEVFKSIYKNSININWTNYFKHSEIFSLSDQIRVAFTPISLKDCYVFNKITSFLRKSLLAVSSNENGFDDNDLKTLQKLPNFSCKSSDNFPDLPSEFDFTNDYYTIVPISGSRYLWTAYDFFTEITIKHNLKFANENEDNKTIDFLERLKKDHKIFMEKVYNIITEYEKYLIDINHYSITNNRILRLTPIWYDDIRYISNNLRDMTIEDVSGNYISENIKSYFQKSKCVVDLTFQPQLKQNDNNKNSSKITYDFYVITPQGKTILIDVAFDLNQAFIGYNIIPHIERLAQFKLENNIDLAVIVGNKNFDKSPIIVAEKLGVTLLHQDDIEDYFASFLHLDSISKKSEQALNQLHEMALEAQKDQHKLPDNSKSKQEKSRQSSSK